MKWTVITLLAAVVCAPAAAKPNPEVPVVSSPTIVFIGDSLTEGYGVKPSESYPALIGARLRERGWAFIIDNEGRSGDTSGEALARTADRLRDPIDVLVIALGANDGFQHLSPKEMDRNLRRMVEKAYAANKHVHILILGMRMPLEQGDYAHRFNDVFQRIAWEYRTAYFPFLLDGVIDVPELTLADRLHPNAAGYRVVADHVWGVLEPLLRRNYPQLTAAASPSP